MSFSCFIRWGREEATTSRTSDLLLMQNVRIMKVNWPHWKKLHDFTIKNLTTVKAVCCNYIKSTYFNHFSKVSFTKDNKIKTSGYCYHSIYVITNTWSQNDHVKRLSLNIYELWYTNYLIRNNLIKFCYNE